MGASWEGFALNQFLQILSPTQHFFWSTYSSAELDLLFLHQGRRYGVEFKFNEAPKITRSMRVAIDDLKLDQLWIIYPGEHKYPADEKIQVWPLQQIPKLFSGIRIN